MRRKVNKKIKIIYRNSKTGRITTKKYARKNPRTTEKERVRAKY